LSGSSWRVHDCTISSDEDVMRLQSKRWTCRAAFRDHDGVMRLLLA